jgi:hypothetical protein
MARAARSHRPWFSPHRVVTPDLAGYLEAERSAAAIRGFGVLAIPGLLQTADYARAILRGTGADRVEERVDLLLARQELLDRDDCPDICYVLDEGVLHRRTGGLAVISGQLGRLRETADHPRVSVRVVPFTAGRYPADGSFTLIEFGGGHEDAVYLETADGRMTSRRDRDVGAGYRDRLAIIGAMSLGPAGTGELLLSAARSHE